MSNIFVDSDSVD